jgi:hypothetical protein
MKNNYHHQDAKNDKKPNCLLLIKSFMLKPWFYLATCADQSFALMKFRRSVLYRHHYFLLGKSAWRLGGEMCLFVLLFLFPFQVLAREDPWVFLPATPLFEPLIADPMEPQTSLVVYGNQSRFEGAVGGTIEIARSQPSGQAHWGLGLFGAGFILLDQNGATFPMRAGDWYAGIYASESFGLFENRLQLEHKSSHLGDSLQSEREVLIFNGENVNFTTAIRRGEWLRLYAGAGYWFNFYPAENTWFASLGSELYTSYFDIAGLLLQGYSTIDLNWKTPAGGTLDKNLQLGLQWKFEKQQTRSIRVALVYHNGRSEFGHFYTESDEHWGFGFYFDP